MNIVDHLVRGVPIERFMFMATNKLFGFGGDANRKSDWSVRLPVYIEGQPGYIETFIVEGSTPLLIGRPILQALNIKIDYNQNKISVQYGEWKDTTMGEKGEYLLQLDHGLEDDPMVLSTPRCELSSSHIRQLLVDDAFDALDALVGPKVAEAYMQSFATL